MSVTYVVKDLGELAEDFRKKADHLRKLGDGRRGHWPVKDRSLPDSGSDLGPGSNND